MPGIECDFPGCTLPIRTRCADCSRSYCVRHIKGGVCDLCSSATKRTSKKMALRGLVLLAVGLAIGMPGAMGNVPVLAVLGVGAAWIGIIMLFIAGVKAM